MILRSTHGVIWNRIRGEVMKTEEAIEKLKRLQKPKPWETQIDSEMFEALEMGIEALEKQIPMKPLPEEVSVFGKTIKPCGFCGDDPGEGNFCQWCGQRISE